MTDCRNNVTRPSVGLHVPRHVLWNNDHETCDERDDVPRAMEREIFDRMNAQRKVLEPGWDRPGIGVLCTEDRATWATPELGRTRGADRPPLVRATPLEEPVVRDEPNGPSC